MSNRARGAVVHTILAALTHDSAKVQKSKDKSRPTVRGDKIVVASWTIFRRDENDMAKALLLIGRPTLHWCVYIQAGRTSRCISEQRFRTRVTTDDTLTTMNYKRKRALRL